VSYHYLSSALVQMFTKTVSNILTLGQVLVLITCLLGANYTIPLLSHHGLSVLQPRNFSRYHTYLLTSVGTPSATALLQHGIQFLLPLKIVPPLYSFKCHLKFHLGAQLINN